MITSSPTATLSASTANAPKTMRSEPAVARATEIAAVAKVAQATTKTVPSTGLEARHGCTSSAPNSATQASCDSAIRRELMLRGAADETIVDAVGWVLLVNARPDATPPDVREEGERSIAVVGPVRVVDERGAPADVLAGHNAPIAAVLRIVARVAHHEEA